MIRSSEQNGWDLEKLGPVGRLTAVALGEPLCSRLSGSWERPANTDNLGVGRCEETWLMFPAGQKVEGVTGTESLLQGLQLPSGAGAGPGSKRASRPGARVGLAVSIAAPV